VCHPVNSALTWQPKCLHRLESFLGGYIAIQAMSVRQRHQLQSSGRGKADSVIAGAKSVRQKVDEAVDRLVFISSYMRRRE
jgi:hypothetical protein